MSLYEQFIFAADICHIQIVGRNGWGGSRFVVCDTVIWSAKCACACARQWQDYKHLSADVSVAFCFQFVAAIYVPFHVHFSVFVLAFARICLVGGVSFFEATARVVCVWRTFARCGVCKSVISRQSGKLCCCLFSPFFRCFPFFSGFFFSFFLALTHNTTHNAALDY